MNGNIDDFKMSFFRQALRPVRNAVVCKVPKNFGLANNSMAAIATISNNGSSLVNASVSIIMILMNASLKERKRYTFVMSIKKYIGT